MKKVLLFFLVTILALSLSACQTAPKPSGTVIIGTPSLNGDFVAGFGNSAYDNWVRAMIYGYPTYAVTPAGEFVLDETVVKNVVTSEDGEGNKTYTFEINNDLKWSDGVKVTAADFVFGLLFAASPEWAAAGASSQAGRDLVGHTAYKAGETDTFPGVKLLDTYKFSLTIAADRLPYFYELAYVAYGPSPLHVWGQGVEIGEDGSSLTGDVAAAANYVATVERFAPTIASGPFKFVSYQDNSVVVVNNEEYAGDWRGHKGKLESVIVRVVNQDLSVDLVISGDIDISAGEIEGAKIEKAQASPQADTVSYLRNGYGFISYSSDFGPTADPLVRRAYAFLIDRQEFLDNILEGYGAMVNSEYGLAQWMYVEKGAELEAQLFNYTFNPDAANDLLDQTEWKFEADGVTPFDRAKAATQDNYFRHNADGERLVHKHLGSTETLGSIGGVIRDEWPKGMKLAGVEFIFDYIDFATMLNSYYVLDKENREYHSYNLAVTFSAFYDPYYSYHSDFYGDYYYNANGINDPVIDRTTKAMRELDPSQREEFLEYWMEFQVRWNELMPKIPLYSNEYFDVFNVRVEGLQTTPFWSMGQAMIDVSVKGE